MDKTDLRDLLAYDPETGLITRKTVVRGVRNKTTPGTLRCDGYYTIGITHDGKRHNYLVHRLAWFLHHGSWAPDDVDHIDGNRANNRLVNFRLATRSENHRNRKIGSRNKSGVKGVRWDKERLLWKAEIGLGGSKSKLIGRYATKEEAAAAYWKAAQQHFGEFARAA